MLAVAQWTPTHPWSPVLVQQLLIGQIAELDRAGDWLAQEVAFVVRLRGGGAGGAPVSFILVVLQEGPQPAAHRVLQGEVRGCPWAGPIEIPSEPAAAPSGLGVVLQLGEVVVMALSCQVQCVIGARSAGMTG